MTTASGATILLVDDDEDALQLLRMVMERSGYTVHCATNGLEALAIAEQYAEEIESIILDLMMPGDLDGYAVCDRLSDNPDTQRVPIIVLSAKSSARDMMRSFAAGAFQHITKPYDIQYLLAVVESMIRFRRLEREAMENAEKFRAIVDNMPLSMLAVAPDLSILEMNTAFRKAHPDAEIGQSAQEICYDFGPEDQDTHPVLLALKTGENQHAIVERERDEKRSYAKVHAAVLRNDQGSLMGVLDITEDVTEHRELEERLRRQIERHNRALRQQDLISDHLMTVQRQLQQKSQELEKANAELERLSVTDPLTGIPNRRRFDEILGHETRRCKRYHHSLSVLMGDLDKFKDVNDTYGHAVGDEVLVRVAELLQHHLRETDTVARYGGEEFVAILPETDLATAMSIADRLREAIGKETVETDGTKVSVTISLGAASASGADIDGQTLIEAADAALYRAKRSGRNKVEAAPAKESGAA